MLDFDKNNGVFQLKDLVEYEAEGLNRVIVEKTDSMMLMLLAFNPHVQLADHKAPGNAIVSVLEGSVVVSTEGKEYRVNKGESIAFKKDQVHAVNALDEAAKVALLVTL